jgi:hypothetical protein
LINSMAAEKMYLIVEAVIGGNLRIIISKDMDHGTILKEPDTSDNIKVTSSTDMENSDFILDKYITESGKRINTMAMDMKESLMEMNILESTKMTRNGEREYPKRTEYYIETNIKKETASTGVKSNELLQPLRRNMFKY